MLRGQDAVIPKGVVEPEDEAMLWCIENETKCLLFPTFQRSPVDQPLDQTVINTKTPVTNILIVDDDPILLDTLCFMVTSMGFTVHQAKDGMEAVALFEARSDSISLVIMDVEMPRLGGIEATHIIRKMNPSTKVILCSGSTKRDVWSAGPDAFLPKPFLFHDLRAIIRHLLQSDGDDPTSMISEG
jgi:CheY-like chemotaxis protein